MIVFARARVGEGDVGAIHPREAALLPARSSEKRRADFVAGRLAARRALDEALGPEPDRWVDRDELGELLVRARRPCFVSITHVDGVATAAVADVRLGIDAVVLEPPSQALIDETASPDELAAFASTSPLAAELVPVIVFGAKEAALKWLGTGMRVGLRELRVEPAGERAILHVHDERFELDLQVRIEGERALVVLSGAADEAARARVRARCRDEERTLATAAPRD